MLKRLTLALLALCFANVAFAQTFPQPPDAYYTGVVTPVYETTGAADVPIDSTVTPMPITSTNPVSNIPVSSPSTMLVTNSKAGSTFNGHVSSTALTIDNSEVGTPTIGDYFYGTSVTGGTGTTITGGSGTSWTISTNQGTIGSAGSPVALGTTATAYCLSAQYSSSAGPGVCAQNKFRTQADFTGMGPFDPVRNYGQGAASHLHCFFGSGYFTDKATYATNRQHALESLAAGTGINGTMYWFPCIESVGDPALSGKTAAIRPDQVTVYYVQNPAGNGTGNSATAPIPVGNRYVFGFDMDSSRPSASFTANTTIGSPTLTNVADIGGISAGQAISDPVNSVLPAGTTVVSVSSTGACPTNCTVTVSNNATATTTNEGFIGAGEYSWLQSALDTANTTYGSTRYKFAQPGNNLATQATYACNGTGVANVNTDAARYIVMPDGTDPFGGTCNGAQVTASQSGTTLTVTAVQKGTVANGEQLWVAGGQSSLGQITGQLTGTAGGVGTYSVNVSQTLASQTMFPHHDWFVLISGANCYDGTNTWSPGAYKHLIMQVFSTVDGGAVCPKNFYAVARLTLEIHYTHFGFAQDRQYWDLSSDIAYRAKWGFNKQVVPPGLTFHTDWLDGWDHANGLGVAEKNCLAVEHNAALGHECNTSQIDSTHRLAGGSSDAGLFRNPQVDNSPEPRLNATDHGWMPIPSAWSSAMSGMTMCSQDQTATNRC